MWHIEAKEVVINSIGLKSCRKTNFRRHREQKQTTTLCTTSLNVLHLHIISTCFLVCYQLHSINTGPCLTTMDYCIISRRVINKIYWAVLYCTSHKIGASVARTSPLKPPLAHEFRLLAPENAGECWLNTRSRSER